MTTFDHSRKQAATNKPRTYITTNLSQPQVSPQRVPTTQPTPNPDAPINHDRDANGNPGWWSRLKFDAPRDRVQPKLTVGAPNDQYEQEADRVAAEVINQISVPEQPSVQREDTPEEDALQMKPLAGQITLVQREEMAAEEEDLQMQPVQREAATDGMDASPDVEAGIEQARGSGQPLDKAIREPMEQAFGADFSGVKIHTDAQSDQLNHAVQAKAFTTKQDVFFRQGEYNPGSRGGQELLAHELTHVVQQNGGAMMLQRVHYESGGPVYLDDDDPDSELLDDNFDEIIKGNLHQPTADGTVEEAVSNNTNINVVLWRSTTGSSVADIVANGSAGGAVAQVNVAAPGHQVQQDQIAVGGVAPEYTASSNVSGFSWRHWMVVVRINTRYLTRGSGSESGWICSPAAPVVVLDTVDRTMGLPEPPGFGAA